jgi:hypothetical protein
MDNSNGNPVVAEISPSSTTPGQAEELAEVLERIQSNPEL